MKPNLGDVLADKYRLDAVLGEGGMSMVFAAVNVFTGKQVAIKWLQPEIIRDEEQSQRLLREAQATSSIDHPNVVNVFDVGRHQGALFLVMEHLHGEPLSEVLVRGRQDPVQFIKLMMPVLRGVQAAHRMGVVHRDLKPDNIFFCRDPHGEPREPKVLDFGISKLADDALAPGQQLTREGTVFGTPQYMAPEQMRDARVADVRSDVYALGVIFYRAFADEYPYDADTLTALAIRIVEGDAVPLHELCPELDVNLADIVMRTLALDPDHRYQSVAALGQALEPYADGVVFSPAAERDSSPGFRRDSAPGQRDNTPSLRRSQPLRIQRSQRLSQPARIEHSQQLSQALQIEHSQRLSQPARIEHSQRLSQPLRIEHSQRLSQPARVAHSQRLSQSPSNASQVTRRSSPLDLGMPIPVTFTGRESSPEEVGELLDAAQEAPAAVAPRPSRVLDLGPDDPEATQRLSIAPRAHKRSVLAGATLFAVGLLAPLGWQFVHKPTGTAQSIAERAALAVSQEIPSTRFAMASAKLAAQRASELLRETTAPVAPPPEAREPAKGEQPASVATGLEAPEEEALPTSSEPAAALPGRAADKLKRRGAPAVHPALRPQTSSASPSATQAAGGNTQADTASERPLGTQTERNPYLRR